MSVYPDCDAPNRHCVCVYRERIRGLEREVSRLSRERGLYLRLWQAAAACLNHNRDRLRKPRGEDERQMLEHAEQVLGPFYGGGTDGILPEPAEQQQELEV